MKRSSLISYSEEALRDISESVIHLARLEGLEAHARAVEVRLGVGPLTDGDPPDGTVNNGA